MASIIVLASVLLLDVIAFGLAVAAEQRRSKASPPPLPLTPFLSPTGLWRSRLLTYVRGLLFLQATVTPDSEKLYDYCVYDSDIATGYGVGALLLLAAAQAVVMLASKCFCCGRGLKPGGSRACALILFLFAWLTFLIAEACLMAGSIRNAYHTRYRGMFVGESVSCETVRKGVFAAGAAFTFFTAILSEFYYVSYSKSRDAAGGAPYGGSNIGMGTYS
uniref:Fiber protein Fb34 n=2 Tax=Oryza TaxID=4527 RepID=A0A0E0EAY1_9ORYZ